MKSFVLSAVCLLVTFLIACATTSNAQAQGFHFGGAACTSTSVVRTATTVTMAGTTAATTAAVATAAIRTPHTTALDTAAVTVAMPIGTTPRTSTITRASSSATATTTTTSPGHYDVHEEGHWDHHGF